MSGIETIEQFLARGGKIQKIPTGASAHLDGLPQRSKRRMDQSRKKAVVESMRSTGSRYSIEEPREEPKPDEQTLRGMQIGGGDD